jgi:hypothetical protein
MTDWRNFEFPVQYIETDNLAFARKAFSILNGRGKKKQTAYQKLRNEVFIVRIDEDTSDEDDVKIERKVSIAEKHDCYPVEPISPLAKHPGTFSNIATFKTLSDDELELACGWHNKYFHYVSMHVSCFFMFRDMARTYKSAKKEITEKLQNDLAAMIQGLFGDLYQYQESVTEAYRKWHVTEYGYEGAWRDEAYAVALLQLYKHFSGTEHVPQSLIDHYEDLINFFDPAILAMTDFNFEYQEVVKRPNPMINLNPLKRGTGKVVDLQDRIDTLQKSHKWRKAIAAWEAAGFKFDMSRMPKVAMVRLGDILIDEDIQRALDEAHCAGIIDINKFDPALLQTLQCIKTSDGRFVSIDGQHTSSVIAGLIFAGAIA